MGVAEARARAGNADPVATAHCAPGQGGAGLLPDCAPLVLDENRGRRCIAPIVVDVTRGERAKVPGACCYEVAQECTPTDDPQRPSKGE